MPEHYTTLGFSPIEYSAMQLEQYYSAEPLNHFEDAGSISRLIRLDTLKCLWLEGITFTFDECKALRDILSSDVYQGGALRVWDCSCMDGGGQLIGNGVGERQYAA